MTLSKYERETIIIYNQAEPNAMVYTHDPKLIAAARCNAGESVCGFR